MRLITVAPDMLPFAWPDVEPWIATALARVPNELTLDGLRGICERGEGALVLIGAPNEAPVAAGVTQVRDHAGGARVCWILALGGHGARAWLDTLLVIEANARRIGCAGVHFVGRPGWAALLPGYTCHCDFQKALR